MSRMESSGGDMESSGGDSVQPHPTTHDERFVQPRDDRGWTSYRPWVLAAYDFWVHRVSDRWLWRCPKSNLERLYDQHLQPTHLELGVGTGTLLAQALKRRTKQTHSKTSESLPVHRLHLADANSLCLSRASRCVQPWLSSPPVLEQVDLRDSGPSDSESQLFDSAALVFLLHCIPGSEGKRNAIRFASHRLQPNGVCFGATLIGQPIAPHAATRWLENRYRRAGIFANADDQVERIRDWLEAEFKQVKIELMGRAALFVAKQPHRSCG